MWLVVKINYCIFENQNNQHYISTDKYSWFCLNLPDEENKWGMSCFRGFTAPVGHQMISVEHWTKKCEPKMELFLFHHLWSLDLEPRNENDIEAPDWNLIIVIEKSIMMMGDEDFFIDQCFITCWVEARRRQREQQRDQAFGLFGVERQAVAPRSSRIFCIGTLVFICFFALVSFCLLLSHPTCCYVKVLIWPVTK